MEKVEAVVAEMEEKTKETYYASAFVPNFANKLFSGEDRAVKVEKLMDVLKRQQREQAANLFQWRTSLLSSIFPVFGETLRRAAAYFPSLWLCSV